jgi:DNA sulfur modification protein DndD
MPSQEELALRLTEALGIQQTAEGAHGYRMSESARSGLESLLATLCNGRGPAELIEGLRSVRSDGAAFSLTGSDASNPGVTADLRERHQRLLSERDDTGKSLARCEERLSNLRRKREDLLQTRDLRAEDLSRAEERDGKGARLRKDVDLCRRAASCAETLTDRLRTLRVDDLERAATDMYRRTTNKPGLYNRVAFDRQTLCYTLLDQDGRPAPIERSTGERGMLSLAVVHGLQSVSGRPLPLVVEAPFKPLDPVHTEKAIHQAFGASCEQAVLLLKPEEVPQIHAAAFRRRVGQWFVLERPEPGREVCVVRDKWR